jgi:hypothetical protein
VTVTIQRWTGLCRRCDRPIVGRDIIRGDSRERKQDHVNPSDATVGGIHRSAPDETTIYVTHTNDL